MRAYFTSHAAATRFANMVRSTGRPAEVGQLHWARGYAVVIS